MDQLQLRRSEHCPVVALIALHVIGDAEFFKEPKDALRTAIFKVVNDEGHGGRLNTLIPGEVNRSFS
jgi:hypothetical protein